MTVLKSLLSSFRNSRNNARRTRRVDQVSPGAAEALEQRLLLTNPDPFDSNPGAAKTIYLDFDGHTETNSVWTNNGNLTVTTPQFSADADLSTFSDLDRITIEEVFRRVSEDFAPFGNVNVTTVEPAGANPGEVIFVSIGGSGRRTNASSWSSRSYNDAKLNGFTNAASSNTVFVFARDYTSHLQTQPPGTTSGERAGQLGRDIANGVSEAVGIAMGLSERATTGTDEVSPLVGTGTFARGWRDVWSNQLGQDDLAILTNGTNGFTFVADDHGDAFATATSIATTPNTETVRGLIGQNGDVDVFHFNTAATSATFSVRGLELPSQLSESTGQAFSSNGSSNSGSNLDPTLTLFDANGTIVSFDNPAFTSTSDAASNASLTASITQSLPAGDYYLQISTGGEYGNLGQYELTITGVDQPTSTNVIALQSKPNAPVNFYLDFNGARVTEDEIIVARADGIDQPFYVPAYDTDGDRRSISVAEEAEIIEIYRRIAEDFAPFDVNVTTVDPFLFGARAGLQTVIGGDGSWHGVTNATGFAALDTFGVGAGDNMAIAFSDLFSSNKETALETSAAIANALGIETHYTNGDPTQPRLPGYPAYGAIGGDSVNSLRDIFQNVAGSSSVVPIDPLAIITNSTNRIRYRSDDHGNDAGTASLVTLSTNTETLTGIIESNTDVDVFSFETRASNAAIISITGLDLTVTSTGATVPGVTNPGANLDPVIQLLDENFNVILQDGDFFASVNQLRNDNTVSSLKAVIATPLATGRYFLRISGQRDPSLLEYGNIGTYTVTLEGIDGTDVSLSFLPPDPANPSVIAISENAGTVVGIGRVDRPRGQPITAPLVVQLQSTDTTELVVPPSVTILPGQTFALFNVTAVDDDLLDGEQRVVVNALVNGVISSSASLRVLDYETITTSLNPSPVREDAGPGGATLTVARSNTDIGAANHWVAFGSSLREYDIAGNLVRTVPIEWPTGSRPAVEVAHDVQVLQDGNVAVFNGTGTAFLSVFNVSNNTWQHFAEPGLSANTTADPTIGGITSIGDYVFLSDFETFNGDARGIVRINTFTGAVDRFADTSVGARLFAANGSSIVELEPITGEVLKSLAIPVNSGGFSRTAAAVAFDGAAVWVLVDDTSFGTTAELLKISPDTGALLETHSVPGTFDFGRSGMTVMNGLIYITDGFNTLSVFGGTSLLTYNPTVRQVTGNLIPIAAQNNLNIGVSIGSLPSANKLLVTGYSSSAFGFLTQRIYEIDPTTGFQTASFLVPNSSYFDFDGITSVSDVTIGGVTYNDLIYVNSRVNGLQVFQRNGTRLDINPATSPIDPVPNGGFPTGVDIGGGDVPGVTSQDQSFRDVTIGLHDGLLYGLLDTGTGIAVHDPDTLAQVNTITLDAVVNAISIDRDGNILGGGPNGIMTLFDPNGVTISSLATGLASIADIDTNVSEALIISDVNGQVVTGELDAIRNSDLRLLTFLETTGSTSFVSFGRHSTLPTGDLFITLTSSDISELVVPVEVRIPVGQPSVTIPIDVIDDNLRDGTQSVDLAGQTDNYVTIVNTVAVLDAETVGVDIIPATVYETDGTITNGIRVFRTDVDGPFEVPDFSTASTTQSIGIDDNDVTLSQLQIRDQQSIITDVNVTLSLTHSFIPDLDIYLVSPSGTRVALFTDLGTNETTMTSTVFDDEAAVRIRDGLAPYTGRFISKELLSAFDGEDPSGTWTLEINDDNVRDSGVLLGWTLDIETLGLSATNIVLVVSDPSEADVRTVNVTIPPATAEIFIDLLVLDDTIVDGTQVATIGVASTNLTGFDNGSDTVDVLDVENLQITLDKTTISEGDGLGAITGTIRRSDTALTDALVVTLTSNDSSEIAVPVTVTIPVGETSATFLIDAVDDPDFDGDQQVTFTAVAPGYVSLDSPVITVTDQEPRIALTTLSTTVAEDAGTIVITISRLDATDLSVAQTVTLQSNDLTELTVPATFVIPVGAISVNFLATVQNDDLLDGPQVVTITAADVNTANPGLNSGTIQITVEDAEAVQITVPPGGDTFLENAGAAVTGTVRITAPNPAGDTIVTLFNSDLTEVSIPTQVVIPAGETSVDFVIRAVDDTAIDRDQLVTLTGSAAGYRDGSLVVTVRDYEPPTTIGPVAITEDSTPALQWAPVEGATRYDLWVNDLSRNIVQLYRLENLPAKAPFFYEDFESGSFATNGWANSGATIDDLALGEENGSQTAHLNGSPDGGDRIETSTMDLSGKVGVQLKYAFEQTGSGESPDASEDLVISYRNAAGEWVVLERQPGSGPDATVFRTSVIQLPKAALHANFALRFESIGKAIQDGIEGEYDDWFIDSVELSEYEEFTPPQELGVGAYRYWVRAYDNLEQPGFWSPGHNFQVRTRPVISSPVNNSASAVAGSPVISWSTVVDTDYDLWVNDLTRGTSQVIRKTGLQTTSFSTATANLAGGTYKAWVRAGAPDGLQGYWSTPVTFTILSAPEGLRPSGSTFDRTPELGWDEVVGATYYYVWLTRRDPGQTPVVVLQDQFVSGNLRIPEQDLQDGRYVFWVQAIGEDGSRSAWSAGSEFYVAGRPEVISPANNGTATSSPTISWIGVDGSSHYEIWVNRTDVAVSKVIYDANVTSTSYTSTTALAAGTYRVWIRAISEMGERSPWSKPVDFTVASAGNRSIEVESGTGPMLAAVDLRTALHSTYIVMPLEEDPETPVAVAGDQSAVVQVDRITDQVGSAVDGNAVEQVDNVMAEWDASNWWDGSSVVEEEKTELSQAAAMLGLGLAAGRSVIRTDRKKRQR